MKQRWFIRISFLIGVLAISLETSALSFEEKLVDAAIERTNHEVTYDGRYLAIAYPGGDVPNNMGVCTDVIIRAYRQLGVDLQVLVHEDMKANFSDYPSKRIWGLNKTDRNIDHRRVPNLQVFFSRQGKQMAIADDPEHYQPGDIVIWMLPGNLPHIGLVSDQRDPTSGNPLIVHNIGQGPKLEDALFSFPITGHYQFIPQD